jgi:hypothetical protein
MGKPVPPTMISDLFALQDQYPEVAELAQKKQARVANVLLMCCSCVANVLLMCC